MELGTGQDGHGAYFLACPLYLGVSRGYVKYNITQSVHLVFRDNAEKKRDEQIAAIWYDTKTGLGHADARFIAWAREAVPALSARLAEVEKEILDRNSQIVRLGEQSTGRLEALIAAEAENAKMREALESEASQLEYRREVSGCYAARRIRFALDAALQGETK